MADHTFRNIILGALPDFLRDENFLEIDVQSGLLELINDLSSYKEEGKVLFPEIYIIKNINDLKDASPIEIITIKDQFPALDAFKYALKKCAPLATNGWAIYILLNGQHSACGIFRSLIGSLSIALETTIIDSSNEDSPAVLLVHQLYDKVVEIKGTRKKNVVFHFTTKKNEGPDSSSYQKDFINKLIEKGQNTDHLRTFYKRVFKHVLQNGHGTLAVVLDSIHDLPKELNKGVVFKEEISVDTCVTRVLDKFDRETVSSIEGIFSIITGMMMSDGITVFKNNGSVLCYNVFIEHKSEHQVLFEGITGGARSRTFEILKSFVPVQLCGVYMQSQDGEIKIKLG